MRYSSTLDDGTLTPAEGNAPDQRDAEAVAEQQEVRMNGLSPSKRQAHADELAKLRSELELLREINRNLAHENNYLKAENARLRQDKESCQSPVSNHRPTMHRSSLHRISLTRPKSLVDIPAQSLKDISKPHPPVDIANQVHTLPVLPVAGRKGEDQPDFADKNFVLSGRKYLCKEQYLFDELLLFGPSETSDFR